MHNKNFRDFLKNKLKVVSVLIPFSVIFVLLFFPYQQIRIHKYFEYKLFNTILMKFLNILLECLLISVMFLFFIVLGRMVFFCIDRKKINFSSKSLQRIVRLLLLTVSLILVVLLIETLFIISLKFINPIELNLKSFEWGFSVIFCLIFFCLVLNKKKFLRSLFYKISVFLAGLIIIGSLSFVFLNKVSSGPNVVLIVVDTLRSDHTSMVDHEKDTTRSLKRILMPEAKVYKNAFSNSSWTLPSVASLITSQYPSYLGIKKLSSKLGDQFLTIAEILKEYGYYNCGIVSHILVKSEYGLAQGFDVYDQKNISLDFYNHNNISSPGVTKEAIEFIRNNRGRKFFLFLHYFDPHYNYVEHKSFPAYKGKFRSKDFARIKDFVSKEEFTQNDINYLLHCYDSEIEFTDNYIGKVLIELQKNNVFDNSLIVFTSDHGEEFTERGGVGHGTSLYNEQIRIPLLIKLPVSDKKYVGTEMLTPVSNIDILPTILHVLGKKSDVFFQGRNVFSREKNDKYIFSEVELKNEEVHIDKICVIHDGLKLIRNYGGEFELYNLKSDIDEIRNIIGSGLPEINELKKRLKNWIGSNRIKRRAHHRKPLTEKERKMLKSLGYL